MIVPRVVRPSGARRTKVKGHLEIWRWHHRGSLFGHQEENGEVDGSRLSDSLPTLDSGHENSFKGRVRDLFFLS